MNEMPSLSPRQPLGLPKGSVRALLALSVFGCVMALLLLEREVRAGLWMVNYTILGYYFTMRRGEGGAVSLGEEGPAPLRLPRGTVRWLILLGFTGTFGWLILQHFQANKPIYNNKAFFPMLSLSAFFFGLLFQRLMPSGKSGQSKIAILVQDIRALVGLGAAAVIILVSLFDLSFTGANAAMHTSLVFIFFYFGSR